MCDKIIVPDSYLNEVPVPPLTDEPLAKILLEVEIISVLELIEVDAIMTLQYKLSFKWMDTRISFQNLKGYDFLNTVGSNDARKIWHPNVVSILTLIYLTLDAVGVHFTLLFRYSSTREIWNKPRYETINL